MSRAGRIAVCIALVAFFFAGVGAWLWPRPKPLSIDYKMSGNPGPKIVAAKAAAIERRERTIEQTVWAKELDAERHGRVFEDLWDALNSTTNKWGAVSDF